MISPRIFAIRSGSAEQQPPAFDASDSLPDVPSLSETLLLMEIRSRDFCVDLREMSRIVLADAGATLQILRLAAREYSDAENRPLRIEDCISALGVPACLEAAGRQTVASQRGFRDILDLWSHARDIAHYARMLADLTDGLVHPEEAYLVGLLHGLGSFPAALGWKRQDGSPDAIALRLARQWQLPECVQAFFAELAAPRRAGCWKELVETAHEIAPRCGTCSLCDTLAPHLEPKARAFGG